MVVDRTRGAEKTRGFCSVPVGAMSGRTADSTWIFLNLCVRLQWTRDGCPLKTRCGDVPISRKASSATRNIRCLIICSILVGTYVTYDLAIRGRNCVWNGPDWSRGLRAAPEAGEFLTVGRSKRVDWQFGGGPETERCRVWCGLSSLLCSVVHVFYFAKSIFFPLVYITLQHSKKSNGSLFIMYSSWAT